MPIIKITRRGDNLYRMMRNQWKVARTQVVKNMGAEEILRKHNIEVIDANDFVAPSKKIFDFSTVVGLAPRQIPKDENHPLYKEKPLYTYKDNSVLLEGLHQALVLTNTVQLESDSLPLNVNSLVESVQLPNQDKLVKRCIKASCIYDAEQKKLPVRKDPARPAWNFKRDYGITESRKNRMLSSRLLHLCALASPEVSASRAVLHDVPLTVSQYYDDDPVLFQLCCNVFLSSDKPLPPLINPSDVDGQPLPELSISHPLISLEEENFYELSDVFPLKADSRFSQVHTIVVHYNPSEIKNVFDTPVTEPQVLGRSLLKAYTAAVAQARYNHGPNVKDLPEPVVVQCVQTDGQNFHFSVLQLNSADMRSSRRNVYWSLPPIPLYEVCSYVQAVPTLEGYNPQVFKQLLAFYMNNP